MTTKEIQTGDIVMAEEEEFYNPVQSDAYRENGFYYAKLITSEPDGDNDLKCHLMDCNAESLESDTNFVDASSCQKVEHHPNNADESLEERLNNGKSDTRLDVLDEEKENLIQMQEIKSRTVAPDVLELNVDSVVSAENSNQWAIIVDHPSLGDMRFYEKKPVTGWSDEYRIVRLLKSYGIYDGNPYKLQTKNVYVEFTGQDPSLESHWSLLMRDEALDDYGNAISTESNSQQSNSQQNNSDTKREIPLLSRIL